MLAVMSPEISPIKAAMKATNDLFNREVVGKKNFAVLDDVYTSDARILPPGSPMISGRDGIRQFWKAAVDALQATSAVLTSIDIMPAGDGMVEIGAATIGGPAAMPDVKYVVYWRQEEGRWKWHVDIWNMNAVLYHKIAHGTSVGGRGLGNDTRMFRIRSRWRSSASSRTRARKRS